MLRLWWSKTASNIRTMDRHTHLRHTTPRWSDVLFAFAAELIPLLSVPFALLGMPYAVVAIAVFFCAGLGWFMVDEPGWGFAMLMLRPLLAAIGLFLVFWTIATCLFGCSRRYQLLFDTLGILWLAAAFLTPVISAIGVYVSGRQRVTGVDQRQE